MIVFLLPEQRIWVDRYAAKQADRPVADTVFDLHPSGWCSARHGKVF